MHISIYPQSVLFANGTIYVGETILVHDPIGFLSFGCFSRVKNQRFLNSNRFRFTNRFIRSGRLPVPGSGRPIRPRTVRVPWVVLVEVDFSNDRNRDLLRGAFAAKVVDDEFFIGGVESESRGQVKLCGHC
ncbi:hypothetical protein CR513_29754, partial [Mucuna pruriens]